MLHAATSVPNHLTSELQDLHRPVGVSIDLHVEDGAFILGDSPGLGVRVDEELIRAANRRLQAPTADSPNVRPERAGRRLLAGVDGLAAVRPVPAVSLNSHNEVTPTAR